MELGILKNSTAYENIKKLYKSFVNRYNLSEVILNEYNKKQAQSLKK